jgi:asparagine synthetase B (glutamine-hydrolysing)
VGQYDVMCAEREFGDRLSRYRPSKLELVTGLLLGDDPDCVPLPVSAKGPSLAEALASTILPALHRQPCCVSFSGGLDSSVILATATDLALRHGLPLPIPVTLRFPGLASATENTWQELVISHLRLPDWVKMDFTSELDALGPIARLALRRFGVLTPPNWYVHQPMIQAAAGGSLLTGIGGDEIFGSRGELWWLIDRPPWSRLPRELARTALHALPKEMQLAVWASRSGGGYEWLQPETRERVRRSLLAEQVLGPLAWSRALRRWCRTRQFQSHHVVLAALGLDYDVVVTHPFLNEQWLAVAGRTFGWAGPGDRQTTIREHFGTLLPEALVARKDKATFGAAIFSDYTRDFVKSWDGGGLDPTMVDVPVLRARWSTVGPDSRTQLLLQTAWAAS